MSVIIESGDTELVFRLQQGDVEAFDALYWKYHQAVYGNIQKLTKENEATKDILQEVFITLWEKRHLIDGKQSVSGWLFVVSYNKAISYLKRASRKSIFSNELNEELQAADEPDFDIRKDQIQLLEKALEQLSPQKRKVFELCKLQGRSYEETAKELNISKHTVKEYLSSAVSIIKTYIKENPGYTVCLICPALFSHYLS